MKFIITTIFLLLTCLSYGQDYSQYKLSSHAGYSFDADRGNTTHIRLNAGKHLGLGIYSNVSFQSGHNNKFADLQLNGKIKPQSTNHGHYYTLGIGLSKAFRFGPKHQLEFQTSGIQVRQHVGALIDIAYYSDGDVDLDRSFENYSTTSDYGFSFNLLYQIKMAKDLSLDFGAGYNSVTEDVILNLGASIYLSKGGDIKATNKKATSDINTIQFKFGYSGGDGTEPVILYELEYARVLWKSIQGYIRYSHGQSALKLSQANQTSQILDLILESEHISSDNESVDPIVAPSYFHSVGLGSKIRINNSSSSSFYGLLGVRYLSSFNITHTTGTKLDSFNEFYRNHRGLNPEIGFEYNYNISDELFVGFTGFGVLGRFQIGVSGQLGYRF